MAPRTGHVFRSMEDRLQAKMMPEPMSGCWLWLGSTNGAGYGQITRGRATRDYAHRASFALYRGAIPEGMHLDHLCRNPSCINPDHLEPVTNAENTRRGLAGSHMRDGLTCTNGHPRSDSYIASSGSRMCRTCQRARADRYAARRKAL